MYPATAAHSSPMSVYRSGLGIRQAFLRNTSATASQQASMLPAPKLTTTSVAAAPSVAASASRPTMRHGTVTRSAMISEAMPSIGS